MTMSSKEKVAIAAAAPPEHEPMEWSAEEEIQLFFALEGLKPVGVNKHFYMVCISDRLSKSLNREVPAEHIWAHLRTLYNLDVLDELEPLPFPNEEREFSLPDEFAPLLSKKRAESEEKRDGATTTSTVGGSANSDSTTKGLEKGGSFSKVQLIKDMDKKLAAKLAEIPKRTAKRTRGSTSLESSSSPSTTPPPMPNNKRRRI